jgi:ethanolamine utilization protein EutQ (cupin superfamily)
MTARAYARTSSSEADWHTAPRKQFAINMTGDLEVEISDGTRQAIGQGDLVYLEDTTGKGHVTRVQSPVTNLFIHVPENWDMLRWARGQAAAG